jgi:hypothetical protein
MKVVTNREKILDTLEYFLERYMKATEAHKDSSGLEAMVIEQFIEQLKWLRKDHKRLNDLTKPKLTEASDGKEE